MILYYYIKYNFTINFGMPSKNIRSYRPSKEQYNKLTSPSESVDVGGVGGTAEKNLVI